MPKTSSLVIHTSTFSVAQTVERLKTALEAKQIRIFTIIDHAKAAQESSLELAAEQVLIFGDPKVGTFLMQENPEIGIELPLKILVWQDTAGTTYVGYKDPILLAEAYSIIKNAGILKKMSQGLSLLVTHAAE